MSRRKERSSLIDSPALWLSVLTAARTSGDIFLEQVARHELARLRVRIVFAEPELTSGDDVGGDDCDAK